MLSLQKRDRIVDAIARDQDMRLEDLGIGVGRRAGKQLVEERIGIVEVARL
jgi:hypothetical protein